MMKIVGKFFTLFLTSIVVLFVGTAWRNDTQEYSLTISGKIIIGTEGKEISEQLPVSLVIYSGESQTGVYETISDEKGKFILSDFQVSPGDTLIFETEYQGVTYSPDEMVYSPDQGLPEIQLKVYETTRSSDAIRIERFDLLINRIDDSLRIGEYYLISNLGDRTWIGVESKVSGINETIHFSLPENAQGLWVSGKGIGERYFQTPIGFVDSQAVQPGKGTSEVFFSYDLPFEGSLAFERQNAFQIDQAYILVSESGAVSISGDNIQDAGVIETESGSAISYTVDALEANEDLSFLISDMPKVVGLALVPQILLGLGIFGAAGFIAYWMLLKPKDSKFPEISPTSIKKIVDFDHEYELNQINKSEYHKERKRMIEEMMRNLRKL